MNIQTYIKLEKSTSLPFSIKELILNLKIVKGKRRLKKAFNQGQKASSNIISNIKRLPFAFKLPSNSAFLTLRSLTSRTLPNFKKEVYVIKFERIM